MSSSKATILLTCGPTGRRVSRVRTSGNKPGGQRVIHGVNYKRHRRRAMVLDLAQAPTMNIISQAARPDRGVSAPENFGGSRRYWLQTLGVIMTRVAVELRRAITPRKEPAH